MTVRRRDILLGTLGFGLAFATARRTASAQESSVEGDPSGLIPGGGGLDQTASLQEAIDKSAELGNPVFLPPGTYGISGLRIPSGVTIQGVPGKTVLRLLSGDAILSAEDAERIQVSGLVLDGEGAGMAENGALFAAANVKALKLSNCLLKNSSRNGLVLRGTSGRITDCEISEIRGSGLFSNDAAGLEVSGNHIHDCQDNGIQIWRSEPGEDGTIVTGNRIERIRAASGGDGQYGNGINIFRAGAVLISNNRISDCAYSAIRDNTGRNCQIIGNSCSRLGETAIFVEFSFDGAIVANNVVDTAALGISCTNYNEGGRLAVVQGNLIRNIFFRKASDSKGIGIAVEADCSVTGNVVENVAGYGIALGWYKYLRDVTASGNLIRDCHIGIVVSADPDAGYALITDNMISGSKDGAIRAMQGPKAIGPDLVTSSAEAYRNLAVYSNVGL